ncbi:hypothetical protein HRbin21_01123 [bacterium HR21]|nr:hypothetical protein HRbin21_01123 [bacterium HR21]
MVNPANVSVRSAYGSVYVTGELQNNTGSDMYFARLGITFYNPDGTVPGAVRATSPMTGYPAAARLPSTSPQVPRPAGPTARISISWCKSAFIT